MPETRTIIIRKIEKDCMNTILFNTYNIDEQTNDAP